MVSLAGLFSLVGSARESVHRTQCRVQLGRIVGALRSYASDNHDLLPDCSSNSPGITGRTWPWDLTTNVTMELEARGVQRNTLYCPSNPEMNTLQQWNFCFLDESHSVRILGYCFLLNGLDAMPAQYRCTSLKGSSGRSPAETELVTDVVDCVNGDPRIRDPLLKAAAEDYANTEGTWKGRTSHLTGLFKGLRPAGGNIAFEDGHVAWRDYSKMQHRIVTGNISWDF